MASFVLRVVRCCRRRRLNRRRLNRRDLFRRHLQDGRGEVDADDCIGPRFGGGHISSLFENDDDEKDDG